MEEQNQTPRTGTIIFSGVHFERCTSAFLLYLPPLLGRIQCYPIGNCIFFMKTIDFFRKNVYTVIIVIEYLTIMKTQNLKMKNKRLKLFQQ